MNPAFGIGVQNTTYSRYYFPRQPEPIQKQFYATRVAPSNGPTAFMNLTEGMERLREGMFAFHTEDGFAFSYMKEHFLENEKCGLIMIKFFDMGGTWHACQKRSPYKEMLKIK